MRYFLLPTLVFLALMGCQRQPEPAPAPSATAATPASTPTSQPVGDLSAYVGAYPTEGRAGAPAFLDAPVVRAAVAHVVPDKSVRDLVLGSDVTATPITQVDGKLLAFGCEPHNCGPHNWAIAIRADGRDPAVCHYDQDRRVARWYPENAAPAPVNGCPSGD